MGVIRQGILGGFSSKTGSVVGAHHRGQDTIRALPRKSKKAATQAQKDQRIKFGLVTDFLGRIESLIDVGYALAGSKITTPMNEAVSFHLNRAIKGVSPNFTFDFTKLSFSSGRLQLPTTIEVESTLGTGKLKFSWLHDEEDDKRINGTDMVTVLVYNPVKDKIVYKRNAVARSVKTYGLTLPADFSLDEVYCYISFNSKDKKNLVSNTHYAGKLAIV